MRPAARLVLVLAAAVCARCSTSAIDAGAPGTQHAAPGTQHAAPGTRHPAPRMWPAWLSACVLDGTGEPARCGSVNVPEAADRLEGRQLSIRVVVVPARGLERAADPILMLVGGPGQGAADLAPLLSQRVEVLRDDRDLVLIDQRGTGQSNGLHCAEPAATQELMGHLFDPARIAACRDELAKRADLTRYTTSAAAADYGVVLDTLGYQHVNVWGTSYGTRLALELARRYPNRVRSLVLDGVVPPTFDWPTTGAPDAEAALGALAEDCRADPGCSRDFPRFKNDVDEAFARLQRGAVTASVVDPSTRSKERVAFGVSDLAYATRGLLYGPEALSLPRLFRVAADGNYDGFAQAYVTRARTLNRQIARGLHLSVYCAEDLPFVDWDRARDTAAGTRIGTYLLDQYRRACEVWPRATVAPTFRDAVSVSVPTLLLTGRRDPVTPPRTAEFAARTLPRSRVVTWKYGGHGSDGLMTPDCRTRILETFIVSADPHASSIDCSASAASPFGSR